MNIQNGDVVRLAGSVTLAEFGLALCDDDGEMLEIDGEVMRVLPQWVDVRIKRMLKTVSFAAPMEGAIRRMVRREEVLEVLDGEARLWPNAAALKGVSDEREGKVSKAAAPVFWTVGVDEIPMSYPNGGGRRVGYHPNG
ncbi:hypothetical protein SynBIOSE41_03467 [Synechococcus sp. BIOS-E4-1]|nr:hypothetical protein SynBIOSE41_03467 [Synechococcus sp. BIOS-E4-1]